MDTKPRTTSHTQLRRRRTVAGATAGFAVLTAITFGVVVDGQAVSVDAKHPTVGRICCGSDATIRYP